MRVSERLHRLLYISRASTAFPEDEAGQDAEISAILAVSRRRNSGVGVTGMLLVHQRWFIQALEGPADAVMTTYGRILRDGRHAEASILTTGPAERREFSEWSMSARRLTPTDEAVFEVLDLKGAFVPAALPAAHVMGLLKTVAGIHLRRGAGLGVARSRG